MLHDCSRVFNTLITIESVVLVLLITVPLIGNAQPGDVLSEIEKLKADDVAVRENAAEVLGEIKDLRAIDSLSTAISDEHPHVRRAATRALAKIGAPAVPVLASALEMFYPDVRRIAAESLGEIKDSRAVEPLCAALDNRYPRVRMAAAEALGKIGDLRATASLAAALKNRNPEVRQKSAEALGEIKDPRAVEPLCAALEDEYPRKAVAKALGRIGSSAVPNLVDALKNRDPKIRQFVAEALGETQDLRAIDPLIVAMRRGPYDVRRTAARALGKIGNPAVPQLASLLAAKNASLRWAAIRTLESIKSPTTIETWIAALAAEYIDVRETAARALDEVEGHRVIEALISALEDENPDVRRAVAGALAYRSDLRVMTVLRSAFEAKRLAIIAGATPFFVKWGEDGTEAVLIKALNEFGNSDTAFVFLKSGNCQLQEAANAWARERDYTIPTTLSDKSPRWGAQ